jgi:tetratricopeptide (TPR) repeat protein
MKKALLALSLLLSINAFAGQGGGDVSPGQSALDKGVALVISKDNAGAEEQFREAIRLDAALVDGYWRLGSVLIAQKKYKDAADAMKKCPDQNNVELREQLGIAYDKLGNPDAVRILEGVVKDKPTAPAANLVLGLHYLKTKDYKKVPATLDAYLKNRPAEAAELDNEVRYKLATAYLLTSEWDAAQREFEALLKVKPNEIAYKMGLGTAYVAKEECSKAITLYERILGEANKQPGIFYNLGKCYLISKRFSDAEREANLYTKAKSTDMKGFILLGDSLFEQGKYQPALTAYQMARNIDKNNATVVAKIGRTDVRLKNYDAAIAELEQAESAAPNDIDVLCGEIEAYAAKKNKEKLNQKADKLSPNKDAKSLKCAAVAYVANGNDEKAKTTLEKSLELDPKNAEAKVEMVKVENRLAGHAFEAGQLPKAEQLLVDAQSRQPDSPQTNRNLGIVYLSAKKCIQADQALQVVMKKLPNDVPAKRLVARAYLCGGKRKEAIATYEKAAADGLRSRGVELAYVWTELGPMYIEDGKFDMGITLLEGAVKEAGTQTALLNVANHNLYWAYFMRGMDKLRDGKQADAALDDIVKASQAPKGTLSPKELGTFGCFEAVAALKAKKAKQAEEAVGRAKAAGGCTFKGEYAKLGVPYLENIAGYMDNGDPAKRETASKWFTTTALKAPVTLAEGLRTLARSAVELAGYDYWQRSDEKRSEANLRAASKIQSKADRHELDHNLAVIDLFYGRIPLAEKVFQAVSAKVPEALCNLGIIKDRQGDGKAALDYYKRCFDRGVRNAKVKEMIDVKERLWGGGGA